MYYEINVSKKGEDDRYYHYFATNERSITTWDKAKKLYHEFLVKFPEPEFKIEVTYWEEKGEVINTDSWIK